MMTIALAKPEKKILNRKFTLTRTIFVLKMEHKSAVQSSQKSKQKDTKELP